MLICEVMVDLFTKSTHSSLVQFRRPRYVFEIRMNRSWPFPQKLGGDTPGLVVESHNDDDDDDPEMQGAGECQAAHEGRDASVAEVDDDEGDNDDDEADNDDNDSDDEGETTTAVVTKATILR